jgi:hypothetical protein
MKRFLPSLILSVPFFIGCQGGKSSDDSAAALLLLAAGDSSPTCSITHNGNTYQIPTVRLSGNSSATLPTVPKVANHAHFAAVLLPAVKQGTTVTFGSDPKYAPGGPSMILGYTQTNCPTEPGNADNAMSNNGFNATNYTYNDSQKKITFNAAGNNKDMIIIMGPKTTDPSGATITRNDP